MQAPALALLRPKRHPGPIRQAFQGGAQTTQKIQARGDHGYRILGMIGRPYDSVFFGHDILHAPARTHRALLHHNRSIGIYRDEHLVIFGLNKEIEYWIGNPRTPRPGNPKQAALQRVPTPDAVFRQLVREATALYQIADELYMNRQYRVTVKPVESPANAQTTPSR